MTRYHSYSLFHYPTLKKLLFMPCRGLHVHANYQLISRCISEIKLIHEYHFVKVKTRGEERKSSVLAGDEDVIKNNFLIRDSHFPNGKRYSNFRLLIFNEAVT